MMADGFDTRQLDRYAAELLDFAQREMPSETKKFVRQEGQKLRKATLALARQRVRKGKNHTGEEATRYHKNIKAGRVYVYKGNDGISIRVHSSKAPHAHLIEHGRRIVRAGKEVGFAEGKHVFADAARSFEREHAQNLDRFLDDLFSEVSK